MGGAHLEKGVGILQRVLNPETKGGVAGHSIRSRRRGLRCRKGDDWSPVAIPTTHGSNHAQGALSIFPKMLTMPVTSIVPDNPPENFGEKPVGSGPWKFVEWRHDDYHALCEEPGLLRWSSES